MSRNIYGILSHLNSLANPTNVEGMARFGINPHNTLGISVNTLRGIAREIGKDHDLAGELWASGIHEARILASLVDIPKQVTDEQMESWVKDLDSWDVCDQVCQNLFARTSFACQKALAWSGRSEEFVKRAGFVLMARLAVPSAKTADETLDGFLPIIAREASDERNYVKKAVNWALRQIGKRNRYLHAKTIAVAQQIERMDSKAARWVAREALKELTSSKTIARLRV